SGLLTFNTSNCWSKGVSYVFNNVTNNFIQHVNIIAGFRFTLRDSYFYGPVSPGPTQITNYAYTCLGCGSNLLENNIFHHDEGATTPNDPETGSVYGYNYVKDPWYNSDGNQSHNSGDLYNLHEGWQAGGWASDNIHGTHHFITLFRNNFNGSIDGG